MKSTNSEFKTNGHSLNVLKQKYHFKKTDSKMLTLQYYVSRDPSFQNMIPVL